MKTAVDTNVLLDLLGGSAVAAAAARRALADALGDGAVVLCPPVYAALAVAFADARELEQFLSDLQLAVEGFTTDALLAAAEGWRRYAAQRGRDLQCARCGHRVSVACAACGAPVTARQHIVTDFLVGGHALRQADRLLTRDAGYYRTCFPTLPRLAPTPPPAG